MSGAFAIVNIKKRCIWLNQSFFHKTKRAVLLIAIFPIVFAGCSNSNTSEELGSPTSLASEASSTSTASTSSRLPNTSLATQSKGQSISPASTNAVGQKSEATNSPNSSVISNSGITMAPTPPQTTVPRFIPFQCSVRVRETSQQPTPSTRAVRVDILVMTPSIDGVWVEARAGNSKDRQALLLDKDRSVTTQMIVPLGLQGIVSVNATSDFSPDSVMCSAQTS